MDGRYKTALVFLVLSTLSFIWFKPDHLIYQTDTTFPFSPLMNLEELFYFWSYEGFGGVSIASINMSYFSIIYIVSKVLNIYAAQAIYYYLFVFISGISTYYLTDSLLLNKGSKAESITPYISSILYMYSSYWISNVFQDPMTTFVFYALLPLFVLSLNKVMLNSKKTIYFGMYDFIFIFSIFLFLPEFYTPYLLLLAFVLVFYVIFYMVINIKIRHLKNAFISILILTATTVSAMAYFLLPTFLGVSTTLSQVGVGPFVSTLHYWTFLNSHGIFYSLLNNGLGIGSGGTSFNGWTWLNFYTSVPFFIIINLTIPVFAFSTLFFVRKFKLRLDGIVWFFYFLAFVGIFLQAGLSGPTGSVYNWLFYHFVFIRAFDTLHLWYSPIIYLSYSVLVGVFVLYIMKFFEGGSIGVASSRLNLKFKKGEFIPMRSNRNILSYVIAFAILIIVMIPSYPVLDGSAVPHGSPSAQVQIPNYVMQTSEYLNSKANVSTVLAMPLFITDYEEAYPSGGYRATNPLEYLLKDPILFQLNGLSGTQVNNLTELNIAINENNDAVANYYLSLLNIKYILVLGDYNSTYSPILRPFSINATLNTLNGDPNVTLTNEYGPYYIYTYSDGNSLVYPSISINVNNETHLYGSNLISTVLNYSYTNWGNEYSNVTLTLAGLSVYFNYTHGITWPFLQINIYNISRSIQNYDKLMLTFVSSANTTVSAQANTYKGTHLWFTGEKTADGLILNTSYNEISELQLFLGPVNTTYNSSSYFMIKGIIPASYRMNPDKYSITDASVNNNQSLSGIKIAEVRYVNPTYIIVNIDVSNPSTFTLVFSQNYDTGWQINNTTFMSARHIIVNNFMNAWVISLTHSGNFSIYIIFSSENAIHYYGYLSLSSLVVLASSYVAILMRKKNKK